MRSGEKSYACASIMSRFDACAGIGSCGTLPMMAKPKKNAAAVALAKKRAASLTPERRRQIAQDAAKARWQKRSS
jgi:hypothetical protein